MKNIVRTLLISFALAFTPTPDMLNAQIAQPDSIVSIVAEAHGLPLVSPDQVPPFGTFWVMSSGFGGPAPLPCPPLDSTLRIYAIAAGEFLVDNNGAGQSSAMLAAQADAINTLINQIQATQAVQQLRAMGLWDSPRLPGGGAYTPDYKSSQIDTNRLWLEMVAVTNQTCSLVIHAPWDVSHEVYDLLYCTNLVTPDWQWVLRSDPDQTNLIVPNATDAQGFYRLGSPNDLVANDSLGTNFWLAFCRLYNDGLNVLSVSIASPVGATGIVTTPGLTTNGQVVVVSRCGDPSVNGTYLLTNLTAQEQEAWAWNYLGADSPSYFNGTNWIVVVADSGSDGYCNLIAYDSTQDMVTFLYEKPGRNLNGTTNDWQTDADDNSPPETSCEQVPWVNQFFSVEAGGVTNVVIPILAMMVDVADADVVESNGIHVVSSQPVSVYALDFDKAASAAFTSYPTPMLGTNYCILARPADETYDASKLAVLATEDNTTVWISPSPTADLAWHASMETYCTNLNAGETYQDHSYYDGDDVTGTWVLSDKPIAVYAGARQAYVPDQNTQSGNPLVQEQLPVESWGKHVLAMSFAGRANGASYRVLAANNDTVITITGTVVTVVAEPNDGVNPWTVTTTNEVLVVTNQAGQFYDVIVDGAVEFQANQPIQVAQFANGCYSDLVNPDQNTFPEGDPCEVLLLPVGHYLATNVVVTLPDDAVYGDFDENHLNLIVAQAAIGSTLVNGLPVAATNFVSIGTSGYVGARLSVTNGVYIITSPQPVGVEVYGFGQADAYSYFGGAAK